MEDRLLYCCLTCALFDHCTPGPVSTSMRSVMVEEKTLSESRRLSYRRYSSFWYRRGRTATR